MKTIKVKPNTKNFGVRVKIIPCSSRNEITEKMADGTLKIKLKAAPIDGEANNELIKFLSKEWKIPKNNIKIKSGKTSKNKVLIISLK